VFPLRGNFINVRENEHKAMTKNKEVQALVDILGLEYHKAYDTQAKRNRLRYGRVLVMADQDTDGSHIKGLILNFFHYFWPSLLHATHLSPFLWQFITPYIKAIPTSSSSSSIHSKGTVGNHGPNGEIWFYTEPEYNAWKDLQSGKSSKYRIKFYKGLGTSTSAEAKQYFCRYEDHIIPFQYTGQQSDQALELVFGQGREGDRREWIRQHRPDTYVEYKKEGLPIETFVDTEYQLFSVYTVMRSIPMLMDGLKPSQRKILYGSFMRQLGQSVNHECKVAQLGASAANITAYHHGEEGLGKVIIQMAQDFVGRNNVPLFFPSGQFGTRKSGGKDAASPRYTHTYFQPYTRTLFPAQDDGLLFREKEDDKLIEPSWYAPIVPVGLCNGSYGMATGFKTDIPCFHPLEIIEVLQRMLHEHPDLSSSYTTPASTFFDETKRTHGHLVPWYVGFRGSIVQHQDQKETTTTTTSSAEPSFVVRGSLEIQDPPADDILAEHKDVSSSVSMVLIIRDLPVKQWTQPYREYMEHRSEWKSTIDFFEEMNGEYDIIIHIGLNEKGAEKVRQLQAKDQTHGNDSQGKRSALYTALGLESQIQYRQLYAFNCDGLLCKYQDPYDMMAAFVPTRLWLYEKRRQALLEEHQVSVDKLNNVVSFLEHVINGSIELRGRTKQDLIRELRERQFRPNSAGNNEDGFDYLLRHNLWTLTREHMEKQYEQKQKAEEKYEALRNTTAVQLWQRELSQLHAQINDHIQYRWSLVLDAKGDGIPKFTPKKRSRARSSTKA
jgi:DNA topoisomerase-2